MPQLGMAQVRGVREEQGKLGRCSSLSRFLELRKGTPFKVVDELGAGHFFDYNLFKYISPKIQTNTQVAQHVFVENIWKLIP